MSCSHAAASSRSASGPRDGLRVRARAATPWTWDQRRGRESARRARARPSAQAASICIKFTLVSLAGTFTDAACRLETSETSLIPRPSQAGQCALVCVLLVVAIAQSLMADVLAHSPAVSRSRRAQTIRPPPVVSVPQPSGPVRASTTSRPCGRPSGCLRRHGPPESSASIRTWSGCSSVRTVKCPARLRECRIALAASSDATRTASSAAAHPARWLATARRTR